MCPAVQYLAPCHARLLDGMCQLTVFFYLHSLSVYFTLSFKGKVYMAAKRCETTVSGEQIVWEEPNPVHLQYHSDISLQKLSKTTKICIRLKGKVGASAR